MLLSDVLGVEVFDADGAPVGEVLDALLIQDGRIVGGFGNQLRMEGIAIGRRSLAVRLGYHRARVRGPAPVRWAMERLARRARYASWEQIASLDASQVRLRCRVGDLDEPPVV